MTVLPTSLRLSQTCLCGTLARKPLAERVHRCDCGITVQRGVWSAYLARLVTAPLSTEVERYFLVLSQNCILWSFVGVPAMSLPCGRTSAVGR